VGWCIPSIQQGEWLAGAVEKGGFWGAISPHEAAPADDGYHRSHPFEIGLNEIVTEMSGWKEKGTPFMEDINLQVVEFC
jgi:hypothetical protein